VHVYNIVWYHVRSVINNPLAKLALVNCNTVMIVSTSVLKCNVYHITVHITIAPTSENILNIIGFTILLLKHKHVKLIRFMIVGELFVFLILKLLYMLLEINLKTDLIEFPLFGEILAHVEVPCIML
jgi:hypothetical protein